MQRISGLVQSLEYRLGPGCNIDIGLPYLGVIECQEKRNRLSIPIERLNDVVLCRKQKPAGTLSDIRQRSKP